MAKIIGNTVGIPNPQSDWLQDDPTKADYIKNKPTNLATKDELVQKLDGIIGYDDEIDSYECDYGKSKLFHIVSSERGVEPSEGFSPYLLYVTKEYAKFNTSPKPLILNEIRQVRVSYNGVHRRYKSLKVAEPSWSPWESPYPTSTEFADLNELITNTYATKEELPTRASLGLDRVDNTPDGVKHVASADEADTAYIAFNDESGNRIKTTYATKKEVGNAIGDRSQLINDPNDDIVTAINKAWNNAEQVRDTANTLGSDIGILYGKVGSIETALDAIIEIKNTLIGGGSV